ncbi:MAG TPA: selenoneine biosynthesis selenosugar synthase SenB [Aquabacterium sp.]|nr:selenoneine biosynthesis selenosugar synthase SenB [Aquabacterium sp.]HQC94558.1 selenoneine biosynthesis selenosugar synthase SenB [Aquabacterium sp.]
MHRRNIVIVTPALADANNGNWQTARRWRQMLGPAYRVRLTAVWPDSGAAGADLMIALHASRSAPSITAWRTAHPQRPLLLVLTGTDLYRDIAADADAQHSLELADRLVVLNDLGARSLPAHLRAKARVLLQSCPARQALPKPRRHLRALMVGHLRAEKDPLTFLQAAQRLAHRPDIRLDHIGRALDAPLGLQAAALAAAQPNYRWLGGLPHGATRRRIQQAHLLVHPSRMEGGAHVVIEALRSGTPVLASRIDGNVGLLGADWPGLFAPGDAAELAALLQRARDDPAMLPALSARAAVLAPRFAPAAESATLHALVADLLAADPSSGDHP